MNNKQAIALGSFCGLASYIKDNPNAVYITGNFISQRLVEIYDEYKAKDETDKQG